MKKRILSLLLAIVLVMGTIPVSGMTASAATEAGTVPVNDNTENYLPTLTYSENVFQYFVYKSNLYKITYTNLKGFSWLRFALLKVSGGSIWCEIYQNDYPYGITLKKEDKKNSLEASSFPTTPNESILGYCRSTSFVQDTSKPCATITCLAVNDSATWTWNGTSAKAQITAKNEDVFTNVSASVSSNTILAANCKEKDQITYTATANFAGKSYTDKKIVDGDAGPHNFTYSASGNVITETCKNNCGHKETATLKLDDSISLGYTGSAIKPLKVEYSDGWAGEQSAEISYADDCITVGSHTGSIIVGNTTAEQSYNIVKGTMTGITATDYSGAYDGKSHNITVNNAPEGARVTYSTSENGTYTSTNPTYTEKGVYTVYYKVEKDNYNDVTGSAAVTISQATNSWITGPSIDNWTYGHVESTPNKGIPKFGNSNAIKVEYKPATANDVEYSETVPTQAGNYKARFTVKGNENYTSLSNEIDFAIEKAKLTVTADDKSKTYGESDPTFTWQITSGELVGEDTLSGITASREDTGEDASTYRITVSQEKDANPNYEIAFEEGKLTIGKKMLAISWGDTTFTYDGADKLPSATVTGTEFNDEVGLKVEGKQKNAGVGYTATVKGITGEKADNYELPTNVTTTFTINKADQDAPNELEYQAETIDEKADGYIKNLSEAMEYRKDNEETYTPITGTELNNLADGTYSIRYRGDDNHNPSPETIITLNNDKKLIVTIPEDQTGYQLTVDKTELKWKENATLTFVLKDGYSKLDNFKVAADGEEITFEEGKYTLTEVQKDTNITVEGVADITPPTAKITLGTNSWNKLFHDITFGLFFKETQSVTIQAEDVDTGSGLDKVYYYLTESELSEQEVKDLAEDKWTEYKDTFCINPQEEYIIYAKAVDQAGNVVYISSEQGIIVDTIAPVISGVKDGDICYGNTTFAVTETYIDTVTVDGAPIVLKEGTYTIEADNKEHVLLVTDKAGNETSVRFTVKKVTSVDDPIEKITEDNVKLEDKEEIQKVLEQVKNLLNSGKTFTEEEMTQFTEMKENAEKLLQIIAATKKEATNAMVNSQKISTSSNKLTISWGRATRADGYDIFVRNCDGKKFSKKPTKTIKKNTVTTYTFKKIGGKKINVTKNYKVKVRAYQYKNGKKVYIGATYLLHVAGKQSKYTNAKKVTLNKTKVTLKAGKATKIKAKIQKVNNNKKLLGHTATIRYYSTNTKVATVDKNGRIKAVATGKAKIYAMAENGKKAVVTVTVR